MSDTWDGDDEAFDFEEEMRREREYELSPAGIAEQNRHLLLRQRWFREAADAVAAAWRRHPEVEAVDLFGSVAVPSWKEVPRFTTYQRARIALWHECKDVDLALWLSGTADLDGLRKSKARALTALFKETGNGVASHQVDVFVMEPGSDRYLGRLCHFNRCPKHKPDCRVPDCGAVPFLQQHEDFVFRPAEALAPGRVIRLFDRAGGRCRLAAEVAVIGLEEGEDGGLA